MSIKDLREKAASIAVQARAKLDEVKDGMPAERAAEIEREFDAMMVEHDKLDARAEREAKLDAAEKRSREGADSRRPDRDDRSAPAVEPHQDGKPSYRDAFHAMLQNGGNASDLSAELREVLRGGVRSDAEFRQQVTGTDSAGGYMVPTELGAVIIKSMAAWGPMYDEDVATTMMSSSGSLVEIPTVNDTGVTAGASTEGAALTDDGGKDVTIGQKLLGAYGFDTEFIKWSRELAMDSAFNVEQLLGELLGERLGRVANLQLTTGTGSGAPNGIVTAAGAGVTAAAAAAVTMDELIDLEHSVDPAYRSAPKCAYMFNDATLKALRKLKDGDGNYLWQKGDVSDGAPATFNGYRYHINQAMVSMATGTKPIIFGDLGKYYVRKVGGPTIGVLRERFWPSLGIAGLIRFDGELGDAAAVKVMTMA